MQSTLFNTSSEGKKNSDLRFVLGICILLALVMVYFSLAPKANKTGNFVQASVSVGR